jgi:hypothetical protein
VNIVRELKAGHFDNWSTREVNRNYPKGMVLTCSHEHCNCRVLIREGCHCDGVTDESIYRCVCSAELSRSRTDPGRQLFGTVSPTGLRVARSTVTRPGPERRVGAPVHTADPIRLAIYGAQIWARTDQTRIGQADSSRSR